MNQHYNILMIAVLKIVVLVRFYRQKHNIKYKVLAFV